MTPPQTTVRIARGAVDVATQSLAPPTTAGTGMTVVVPVYFFPSAVSRRTKVGTRPPQPIEPEATRLNSRLLGSSDRALEIAKPASQPVIVSTRESNSRTTRRFLFGGLSLEGAVGKGEPPGVIPNVAVVKAFMWAQVSKLSNNTVAIAAGFSELDLRAVPDDYDVVFGFTVGIGNTHKSGSHLKWMPIRVVKDNDVVQGGQVGSVDTPLEAAPLGAGEYIAAIRGSIGVTKGKAVLYSLNSGLHHLEDAEITIVI